jgi:thioredoxin 1
MIRHKNLYYLKHQETLLCIVLQKKIVMMHQIESVEQLQQLIEKENGLMIYFYSNRCAPCISLRPKILTMVNKDFSKMRLVFVDSEKHPEIPAGYSVFANPGIIVFFEGREYRRYSKYISIDQLGSEIDRIYQMVF